MPADTWATKKARELAARYANETPPTPITELFERAIREAVEECARVCDDGVVVAKREAQGPMAVIIVKTLTKAGGLIRSLLEPKEPTP